MNKFGTDSSQPIFVWEPLLRQTTLIGLQPLLPEDFYNSGHIYLPAQISSTLSTNSENYSRQAQINEERSNSATAAPDLDLDLLQIGYTVTDGYYRHPCLVIGDGYCVT